MNLIGRCKSIKDLFSNGFSPREIIETLSLDKERLSKIVIRANEEYEKAINLGIEIITLSSPEYPSLLREIQDPPPIIYVLGKKVWLDNTFISMVGTRRPTRYGIDATRKIVFQLVENRIGIVSGFAYGIDTVAHTEALRSGGFTIGVLGTGVDIVYPKVNKGLRNSILESDRGCFISEFPIGDGPEAWHFPRRNRIISGLTPLTVVVEASMRSGAMITASYALEQGREVCAVPGNIDSENSEGTNQLIKEGAKPVTTGDDILEELNIMPIFRSKTVIPKLDEEELLIWNLLEQPKMEEDLIALTGLEINRFNTTVTRLELRGILERLPGRILKRKDE
ncbi:MAG: DNA-processing protein DprA [bacterium]